MKKGQAAMEFLMDYGWAILVVLVAIGMLAYFGVLNPETLKSDNRTISSDDVEDCVFGCIAGTHFTGTKFNIIDPYHNKTIIKINACETFCTLSEKEGMI